MDKYQQHELLGQGNNSVYRATRLSDGVDVALKRVKGWAALEAADQEVALREVAMLETLQHPHTIKLLESFSDGGDLCLVLPVVRPGSRAFEGAALPLSPSAVARVGFQLASALAYLHGQQPQLLHRDIKPANLLLAATRGAALPPPGPLISNQASALVEAGSVLLSDFGSALALRKSLATGTTSGTPAYKASEILREEDYAAPADVWAYGVTLLQLATGHVVGGSSAARRTLMGLSGKTWTLQQALEGAYHDKFVKAGEEEAWKSACAAQHKAWEALEAPLQQLIESCLVVEAESRATAAALLQNTVFEKERRAQCLAAAVAKLEALVVAAEAGSSTVANTEVGGGGSGANTTAASSVVTLDELLAVVEAGAGTSVPLAVLRVACELSVKEAEGAGEAWVGRICTALLGVTSGEDLNKVEAAVTALQGLQGVKGAGSAVEGGARALLLAATRLGGAMRRLRGDNVRLGMLLETKGVVFSEPMDEEAGLLGEDEDAAAEMVNAAAASFFLVGGGAKPTKATAAGGTVSAAGKAHAPARKVAATTADSEEEDEAGLFGSNSESAAEMAKAAAFSAAAFTLGGGAKGASGKKKLKKRY